MQGILGECFLKCDSGYGCYTRAIEEVHAPYGLELHAFLGSRPPVPLMDLSTPYTQSRHDGARRQLEATP